MKKTEHEDAPRKLVTVEEFARQATISRSNAWNIVRDGLVESVKVGRLRRVPVDAIDTYISRLREQAQASQVEPVRSAVARQ